MSRAEIAAFCSSFNNLDLRPLSLILSQPKPGSACTPRVRGGGKTRVSRIDRLSSGWIAGGRQPIAGLVVAVSVELCPRESISQGPPSL
ncbi:hypothetical protein D9M72_90980 [compost metagenome]